jgi:hypothetical protein
LFAVSVVRFIFVQIYAFCGKITLILDQPIGRQFWLLNGQWHATGSTLDA